jgi:hypothetical protein
MRPCSPRAALKLAKKDPQFELPAYKALSEFRVCIESEKFNSFLCFSAFVITSAGLLMPLAGAGKVGKD